MRGVPGSRDLGSGGPGPTFTPCLYVLTLGLHKAGNTLGLHNDEKLSSSIFTLWGIYFLLENDPKGSLAFSGMSWM